MSDVKFEFLIPGKPGSKGRPQASTVNGFVQMITPETTVNYESFVRDHFYLALTEFKEQNQKFDLSIMKKRPVIIEGFFYFKIPKSYSKKRRQGILNFTDNSYVKKPDLDNCLKIVMDALNKIAFDDDSQIIKMTGSKNYSPNESNSRIAIAWLDKK